MVLTKTPLTHCSETGKLWASVHFTGFGKCIGCSRIRKIYWLPQDSESRSATREKICRVQQDKTIFIARIFLWKKSENTHYNLVGSDTEVVYYGQVYALRIRCTYYTEDAVLKVRG